MNEQLEFKIGEGEEPATVAIEENGDAEVLDKPEPPAVETSDAPAAQAASEVEAYSDNVKKRIDKLTARLRETQRREQAALEYARNVQTRAQQLEQQVLHTDGQRMGEAKGRIETQTVALKQIIRKAREEGDVDTETEAMQRLTMLTNEQSQLAVAEAQREAMLSQQAAAQPTNMQPQGQYQFQQPTQQFQQPVQQPQTDPRVEQWASENTWYGRDTVMTHAAWGIHRQLVQAEGFDPTSDEYYDELNTRIRDAFPQKFAQRGSTNNRASGPVQTVAPASRSSGINNARRTVKLTPSQVAIAKKLGVPLEEYAKYVKE
jgi:hypothetical protein